MNHKSIHGLDSLHVACRSGSVNMAFILLSAGVNPNSLDDKGDTPLQHLIKNQTQNESYEMQRLLVRMGADCGMQNLEGDNVFHLMAFAGGNNLDTRLALTMLNSLKSPQDTLRLEDNEGMNVWKVSSLK